MSEKMFLRRNVEPMNGVYLFNGGDSYYYLGEEVNDVSVQNGNQLLIFNDGVANNTTLDQGIMKVHTGGTANDTAVNEQGCLEVTGGFASAVTLDGGPASVINGSAENITILAGELLYSDEHTHWYTSGGARLDVLGNGSVSNVTVQLGGIIDVSENGVAENITILAGELRYNDEYACWDTFGARLDVSGNGSVSHVTVQLGGAINVWENGVAENITILAGELRYNDVRDYWEACGGELDVSGNGRVSDVTVQLGGTINVRENGIAENITILAGELIYNDVRDYWEARGGHLGVSGRVSDVTVQLGGVIDVAEDGVAENITLQGERAYLYVDSNCTVNGLALIEGQAILGTGAIVSGQIDLYGGSHDTRISIGDDEDYEGGVIAGDAVFNFHVETLDADGGYEGFIHGLSELQGGTFVITVDASQEQGFYKIADDVFSYVDEDCYRYTDRTFTLKTTDGEELGTLKQGDDMLVVGDTGYFLFLKDWSLVLRVSGSEGMSYDGIELVDESLELYPGDTAVNTTVNEGGSLVVIGGFASGVTIDKGCAYVINGSAENITIPAGARESAYYDSYNQAYVYGGRLEVYGNGSVSDVTVQLGGEMQVSENGVAENVTILAGELVYNEQYDYWYTSGGYLEVCGNGRVSDVTVQLGGEMQVSENGVAENVTLQGEGAHLYVGESGIAHNVTVSELGSLDVFGGVANDVCVNSGGWLNIESDGIANDATVDGGGSITLFSGGVANDAIVDGGEIYVEDGGVANDATVNGGEIYIREGGVANSTTVAEGTIYVEDGGVANVTTVNKWGTLNLSSGGTANSTTVTSGAIHVGGGIANGTILDSCGEIYVEEGGVASGMTLNGGYVRLEGETTIAGQIEMHGGSIDVEGNVNAEEAVFNFHIENQDTGNDFFIHCATNNAVNWDDCDAGDLGILTGGAFVITVAPSQNCGIYNLIDLSDDFTETISVQNVYGEELGCLTVNGDMLLCGDTGYSLMQSDNALTLRVTDSEGNLNGLTITGRFGIGTGDVLNNAIVEGEGHLIVSEGGIASNTTIERYGFLTVSEGGMANNTILKDGTNEDGGIEICEGGMANGTTVSGGWLFVKGGSANGVNVCENGRILISSGATVTGLDIADGCEMNLHVAPDTYVQGTSAGAAFELKNAVISGFTVNGRNDIEVENGGIMNDATVNEFGYLWIESGGTASSVMVNSGGSFVIASGASATGITLTEGASFSFSVASDTYIQGTSAGSAFEMKEASISAFAINAGIVYVYDGGIMEDAIVNSNGMLFVRGGVSNTTVSSGGNFGVSSGAVANGNTVEYGGWMAVYRGATATDINVAEGGELGFYVAPDTYVQGSYAGSSFEMADAYISGYAINTGNYLRVESGIAEDVTINPGGALQIFSGGSALQVRENGGYVYDGNREYEEHLTFVPNAFSGLVLEGKSATVHSGTTANSTTVNYDGRLIVYENGLVNSVVVNSGGELQVNGGGTATQVLENGGSVSYDSDASVIFMPNVISGLELQGVSYKNEDGSWWEDVRATLHSGTTAVSTTINVAGELRVYESGMANSVVVNSGASLVIFSGGTATQVLENGGYVRIYDAADVKFASNVINDLVLGTDESWDGEAEYDYATLHSGTTANNTVINHGELYVYEGGVANGVSNNHGALYLNDGAVVAGQIDLYDDASCIYNKGMVYAEDAKFNFHVDTRTSGSDAWSVEGMDYLQGGSFAITVSATQEQGLYNLAASAYDFNETFALQLAKGKVLGDLALNGDMIVYRGMGYALMQDNGKITLNVTRESEDTTPVIELSGNTSDPLPFTTLTASTDEALDIYYNMVSEDYDGEWTLYTGQLEITENGTYYFKATDDNDYTGTEQITFTNIDPIAPKISNIAADETGPTNGTVTVTATATDDVNEVALYYSKDGGDFVAYGNGAVFTENGSVVFKAVDAAGNETLSEAFEVTNIDKVAPVISDIAADKTGPTNGTVTVTATATDDVNEVALYYSKDGGGFAAYGGGVEFTENGSVVFKAVDAAGNETLSEAFDVSNIDKTKPVVTVTATPAGFTNGTVELTADFSDNVEILKKEYSLDGNLWLAYEEPILVDENQTVYFKGTDTAGNVSDVSYDISNIDTIAPEAPGNLSAAYTSKQTSIDWIEANDNASGIAGYWFRYASSEEELANAEQIWVEANSTVLPDLTAGSWYCQVKAQDRAGNLSGWSETLEFNANFHENGVINSVGIPALGTIGHDGNYSDVFQLCLDFPGFYGITGDFGKLNGSIALTNGKKSVAKGTIKNGVLTFNSGRSVLLEGDTKYAITINNSDKGKTASDYSFTVTAATVFENGDNTDDWTDMKTMGPDGTVGNYQILTEPGIVESDGWVGYGDTIDYAAFTLGTAASLAFDLNATDAAKFTVYQLNEKESKGVKTYSLKSLQSTTLKKNVDATTKNLLLEAGTYYVSMESTNAKSGGNAGYSIAVSENTRFYPEPDATDNWTDMKTMGADGAVGNLGKVDAADVLEADGWVGFGDAIDYAAFTLDTAASLAFDLNATDAAKFTVYQLNESESKGVKNYSLKSLQSTTLKKNVAATTKNLLLEAGTYYVAMESTNAKSGGDADYSIAVSENTRFYPEPDATDNWTDMKTMGADGAVGNLGKVDAADVLEADGWVGFGDAIDYAAFTLDTAASLAFDLNATDAAKFTVYQLNESESKGIKTYSLKSLQSTTLKKNVTATTKNLLLEAGTYYVAMESTNAKSGGDAGYSIAVSENTRFYPEPDATDNWTDMKTMGAEGAVGNYQILTESGIVESDGWVGYGDAIDYAAFTLDTAASLAFDLNATDAAKFTVYQLNEKESRGVKNYSLKSLQSTTLKKNVAATTKNLLLEAGTYYMAMESTNAKSGGDAGYSIAVSEKSAIFPAGDNSNDTWKAAALQDAVALDDVLEGWVGFGDTADFYKFEVAEAGKLSIVLDDTTSAALSAKQVKFSCLDSKGKNVALAAFKGDTLDSSKALAAGEYYIGISCANAQKFNTSYNVSLGIMLA